MLKFNAHQTHPHPLLHRHVQMMNKSSPNSILRVIGNDGDDGQHLWAITRT